MPPTSCNSQTIKIEESGLKALEMEIEPSAVETLGEETRSGLVTLPFPRASQTRKGMTSNCVEQTLLLDRMDPRRLKQ